MNILNNIIQTINNVEILNETTQEKMLEERDFFENFEITSLEHVLLVLARPLQEGNLFWFNKAVVFITTEVENNNLNITPELKKTLKQSLLKLEEKMQDLYLFEVKKSGGYFDDVGIISSSLRKMKNLINKI